MTLATITLRDVPGGATEFGLVFEGGFQPASHAHQNANLIRKFLDHVAAESGQAPQEVKSSLVLDNEAGDSERDAAIQAVHEMADLAHRPIADRIQIVN